MQTTQWSVGVGGNEPTRTSNFSPGVIAGQLEWSIMRWIFPLLLTACAPTPTDPVANTQPSPVPSLALSADPLAFVPLTGDETLMVIHGPAGGWHLEITGIVRHVAPIVVLTASGRLISNDALLADAPPTPMELAYDEAEDAGLFIEHRLVVDLSNQPDWTPFICDLEGEELEVCVQAQEHEGERFAERCAVFTLQRDPIDDAGICATN